MNPIASSASNTLPLLSGTVPEHWPMSQRQQTTSPLLNFPPMHSWHAGVFRVLPARLTPDHLNESLSATPALTSPLVSMEYGRARERALLASYFHLRQRLTGGVRGRRNVVRGARKTTLARARNLPRSDHKFTSLPISRYRFKGLLETTRRRGAYVFRDRPPWQVVDIQAAEIHS